MQKNKTRSYTSPVTNMNSKWIKNIGIKAAYIKLLNEYTWESFQWIDLGKDVMHRTLPTQVKKQKKIIQMRLHQSKKFLPSKGNDQQRENTTYRMEQNIYKL